jgi:hypothetical protein
MDGLKVIARYIMVEMAPTRAEELVEAYMLAMVCFVVVK